MTVCKNNSMDHGMALNSIKHAKKEDNYYIIQQGYWDEIVYYLKKECKK